MSETEVVLTLFMVLFLTLGAIALAGWHRALAAWRRSIEREQSALAELSALRECDARDLAALRSEAQELDERRNKGVS